MKCDIQILGIVSLKAATRADEMAMTATAALTIHAQGRNEAREVTATGMPLGAWPKLYVQREDLHALLHTTKDAQLTHAHQRRRLSHNIGDIFTSSSILTRSSPRTANLPRAFSYGSPGITTASSRVPQAPPGHIPTSVKFPTFRVRKWISTTHEDNLTTAGRRNTTCFEMSYSGE